MARPTDRDMRPIGPWPKGANNIANESSLPNGAARSLVNGDWYPGGRLRRRQGTTQKVAGATSGLWSDGHYALCRRGTSLMRFVPPTTLRSLVAGVNPDNRMVYCAVNNYIFVSDGVRSWRVTTADDAVRSWGVPSPAGQPLLSVSALGGLFAGSYQVLITYVTADGEESGTNEAAIIDLPNGGGIQLTSIPQPTDSCVAFIRVYMSRQGGTQFYRYASFATGTSSTLITNTEQLDRQLETQFLDQIPGVSHAAFFSGRLMFVVGNMLGWSNGLRLGLYDPSESFLLYPGDISMVAATSIDSVGAASPGLFVGANGNENQKARTFFLSGDSPDTYKNVPAYGSGVVPGTLTYVHGSYFRDQGVPAQMVPTWIATNGTWCVGLPSGVVITPSEGTYAMAVGESGAGVVRERDGIRQVLYSMVPPGQQSLAAAVDSLVITRVKNGVVQT